MDSWETRVWAERGASGQAVPTAAAIVPPTPACPTCQGRPGDGCRGAGKAKAGELRLAPAHLLRGRARLHPVLWHRPCLPPEPSGK